MARDIPAVGSLILGKYRVQRELGRGGMGCVFEAVHVVTGRRLALKCLLPHTAADVRGAERFVREAQAVSMIRHRYIIDVYDVFDDDGLVCLVMPFVDGVQYGDWLATQPPVARALSVLVRAMEAIAAAHRAGIVHRDLKPANLMVCAGDDGALEEPRVLDFGISKMLDQAGAELTASGAAVGTPLYMSLEQLTGARDMDQRCDVFAMGLLLYETLAGRLPHRADNIGALALQRVTVPVPDLATLRPELPRLLCDAVMRCLSNDRTERPAGMDELARLVRPFAGPQGISGHVGEWLGHGAVTEVIASAPQRDPSAHAPDAARSELGSPFAAATGETEASRSMPPIRRAGSAWWWASVPLAALGLWLSGRLREPPEPAAQVVETGAAIPPPGPVPTADNASIRRDAGSAQQVDPSPAPLPTGQVAPAPARRAGARRAVHGTADAGQAPVEASATAETPSQAHEEPPQPAPEPRPTPAPQRSGPTALGLRPEEL